MCLKARPNNQAPPSLEPRALTSGRESLFSHFVRGVSLYREPEYQEPEPGDFQAAGKHTRVMETRMEEEGNVNSTDDR